MKGLTKHTESIYAALRIMAGFMFAMHGAQKILGLYKSEMQPPLEMFSQMWFGGIIELVGGILILVGLQTRWAAFLCSGTMAVAYFQFHWKFAFGPNFFPTNNHGELAVLYCFLFLFIAAKGAGKWALDREK